MKVTEKEDGGVGALHVKVFKTCFITLKVNIVKHPQDSYNKMVTY